MSPNHHNYIRRGWIILLVIILFVPITSWVLHTPFNEYTGSVFLLCKLIGQFSGIVGVQLFAFALILSGRLHNLEKLFGGLDKLYVIHHRIGVIAFSFLAIHPIILAFQYASISFEDVAGFLSPFEASTPVLFGMMSLLGMITLLFLTFYGVIFNYPTLKLAHRFLGAFFFLGFLHVFLIPSSLRDDYILKYSLLGTAGLGIVIFCYRTLFGTLLVPRFAYLTSAIRTLEGSVTEITLTPQSKKMFHLPGQFGILSFPNSTHVLNEEHPFTLSSSGVDGTLRFSIKGLGDFTKLLPSLTKGEIAKVEGPFGEFSYLYGKKEQVWVAGGIGITPFVAMAEHMILQERVDYTVDLFYSVRTDADAVYKELFEKLSAKHPIFTFHLMPSDTKGFITGELLLSETKALHAKDIFICGPPPLMSALTDQLLECNIPKNHIHTERFTLLK